jgi:hypothetical protein
MFPALSWAAISQLEAPMRSSYIPLYLVGVPDGESQG